MNAPREALSFAALRSTRVREEPCRAIVLHTTGGIGGPAQVYRTLRSRVSKGALHGLSIHYVIGAGGEVVQMAPHSFVCLHAGIANEWSIGIEIVCPLFPGASWEIERKRGVARATYRDRVRGRREVKLLDLTEAQTEATVLLVEHLSDTMRIPRRVPTDGGGLLRRPMTPQELASFAGTCGHFQVPTKAVKLDPGTRVLERLRERWGASG